MYAICARLRLRQQNRQCTRMATLKRIRATIVAVEKQLSITYYEGVFVSLGIQHAMHMLHIVLCGLYGFTIFFRVMS